MPRPSLRLVALWLLLATYAGLTARRVAVWSSDVTLWTDAVRHAPCAVRPHLQLAFAQAAAGQGDAAIASFATIERLTKERTCAPR